MHLSTFINYVAAGVEVPCKCCEYRRKLFTVRSWVKFVCDMLVTLQPCAVYIFAKIKLRRLKKRVKFLSISVQTAG